MCTSSLLHRLYVARSLVLAVAASWVFFTTATATRPATATELATGKPPRNAAFDPFEPREDQTATSDTSTTTAANEKPTPPARDPFDTVPDQTRVAPPLAPENYVATPIRWLASQTSHQESPSNANATSAATPQPAPVLRIASPSGGPAGASNSNAPTTASDPCAASQFKPLGELGINIALPEGQMPTDLAGACWEQINAGPNAANRCWSILNYHWDATCLCYRPLYFEEINAERYGYVCGCCLQPAVSAAHFFGTVPLMPYYMAADCPCECNYALGHYRPGSCPPRRGHWPPCDPVAAASAGGVYTGLIFAIP
ncbi:MAG: hypothetical protein IT425_12550 [Pirellulales bacterium]|nr:hypothetical protein [Pirellulales bacterium]